MLTTPILNPDNNQVLFKYLRDVSENSQIRHICITNDNIRKDKNTPLMLE